ncbi:unannotated protein [freshwater metagenome]|uniref:Unannotated protein n=1 Tax=freshwater metagenome TaxID=449393 RepID=A0A6J6S9Z5_9ZZZZ
MTSVAESSTAPITSTLPPVRTGDSGTIASVPRKAAAPVTAVIQKSTWKS